MALPDPPHAHDHAIRQRTAKLLENRDSSLAELLETRDPRGAMSTVEVRAIVVRLRALMMDATFDDTTTTLTSRKHPSCTSGGVSTWDRWTENADTNRQVGQ